MTAWRAIVSRTEPRGARNAVAPHGSRRHGASAVAIVRVLDICHGSDGREGSVTARPALRHCLYTLD